MKKEMPQWAVAVIAVVAIAVLGGVGFMVLGQRPSGPGPDAENIPSRLDQNGGDIESTMSQPPSTPGGPADPRNTGR